MLQINYNIPFLWGKYDNWVNSGVCFAEGVSSLSLTLPSENPRFGGAGVWWSGQTKEHSHIWNANICFCFLIPRDDLHSFVSNVPVLLSHVIPSCWIVLPHAQEAKTFCRMKSMIALYAKMLGLAVSRRWKPLPSPEGKSPPQLKLGN